MMQAERATHFDPELPDLSLAATPAMEGA